MSSHSNVPKLRFHEFSHPWEQRKLSDLTDSIDTGKSKFEVRDNGKYEILGSTSVIGYDESYDYEGDFILTARVGANAGNLYRHSGKVKISDNTVFLQGKHLDFIYYLLDSYDIKKLSFGTGQPLVKASELKSLDLMVPQSETEKQKIGEFLTKLDDTITLHQRKCDELKLFKKGMLQKMFPSDGADVPEIRFPGFTGAWEQRKLSDVVELFGGNAFSSSDSVNEGARWLKIANVGMGYVKWDEESFLPNSYIEKYPDYCLKHGDYVMALTRPILNKELKIAEITEENILLNQRVAKLLFTCDKKFGYQLLRKISTVEKIENELAGTDPPNLSVNTLTNIDVLIPSTNEQVKIGQYFENLDNLITLHQRKCDNLKELKMGLLQQMFVS